MQITLATSNKGKIRELREMLGRDVRSFSEIVGPMTIEENGKTFAENALIKARAVYEKTGPDSLVISDDSGISVPLLGGAPGIYSARYAGPKAGDRDNLLRLIDALRAAGAENAPAYYTAAIAVVSRYGEYVMHGWMHGRVIDEARGDRGFGYDPIFVPEGFEKTLGELEAPVKAEISHRAKAIRLALPVISLLEKRHRQNGKTMAPDFC